MTKVTSKKFIRATALYIAASFARKGASFVLLPLYTAALAASGYGELAMLNLLGAFVTMVLGFGLVNALTAKYMELEERGKGMDAVNCILTFLFTSSAVLFILLNLALPLYAGLLVPSDSSGIIVRLFLTTAFVNLINNIYYRLLQLRFQNLKYIAASLFQFTLTTFLIVYLVLVLQKGLLGVVLGGLAPSVLVLSYFTLRFRYRPRFDRTLFSTFFRFGIWLVLGNLGMLIITFSDRLFIGAYFDLEQVGIYSLGVKIASVLTFFLLNPFRLAFSPFIFQQRGSKHDGINLGFKMLILLGGFGFIGIAAPCRTLIRLFAAEEFITASSVIPPLLLVQLGHGMTHVFTVGTQEANKTRKITLVVWLSALLNIGLNAVLIPRHHILGAAWATLLAYLFMICAHHFYSRREMDYSIDRTFLIKMILATGLLYFGAEALLERAPALSFKIVVYFSALALYLFAGAVSLSPAERGKGARLLARLGPARRILNPGSAC